MAIPQGTRGYGLSQILALIILNDQGERIAVKYTPSAALKCSLFGSYTDQRQYESQIMDKVVKQGAKTGQIEIIIHKDYLILYRNVGDVNLILIGDPAENELLLLDVMNTLYNALKTVSGDQITSEVLLKKAAYTFLLLDEMVEGSMIYEMDPDAVVSRTGLGGGSFAKSAGDSNEAVLTDAQHSFNNAISAARDGIIKTLFHVV